MIITKKEQLRTGIRALVAHPNLTRKQLYNPLDVLGMVLGLIKAYSARRRASRGITGFPVNVFVQ